LSGEWVQIWGDEFEVDGAPDPTRWSYAVGGHGWGNKELQFYTDNRRENAVVEDGVLRIIARRENYEGNEYTSARVISRGKGDFQYGRFVVRARLPDGVGTWPAFWLMPSDWDFSDGGWPDIGEIDVIEHVGYDPGVIHASAHSRDYQWQKGTQKTGVVTVPTVTTEFHEYVLEWTPDLIEVSIDGNPFFTYENEGLGPTKWPYDKPFYLIFNIAVGGEWGSVKGIDADAFPQVFEIDYVRVYQRAEPR
jgi:beta-glucanase (GH16 family)